MIKEAQKYLTPAQLSRMYGIPTGSLANLRYRKEGPKFYKVGKKVLYAAGDVEAWVTSNPVKTIDSI